jgi:trypsin
MGTHSTVYSLKVLLLALLGCCRWVPVVRGGGETAQERIFNGEAARPDQFPYFVSIQQQFSHSCGGTLISETAVLTAAHCIQRMDGFGNLVHLDSTITGLRIGCTRQDEQTGTSYCQERVIDSAFVHPEWDGNPGMKVKDVAVVLFRDPITTITPAPIAPSAKRGDLTQVVGFGNYMPGVNSPRLLYADQVVDYIDESMVVTLADQKGACFGDSGGPLVSSSGVVGVVSFGTDACDSYSDVDGFVYLPSVMDWLRIFLLSSPVESDTPGGTPLMPYPPPPPPPLIESTENGVYTIQVASGRCKGRYLSPSLKLNCQDNTLRLYSKSLFGKKQKYMTVRNWKIITKPSDKTVYLQSTSRETCVNNYVQSRMNSYASFLGPINEGWMLQKVSPRSRLVYIYSADTGEYLSASSQSCKIPSSRSKKKRSAMSRLKFSITRVS